MRNARVLFVGAVLLGSAFAGAASGTVLGQTMTAGARMDGVLMPSGGTISSPATISTEALPVIVSLTSGQVLTLGLNSAASFQTLADGQVRVAVDEGTLAYQDPAGGVMQLAANQVLYASAQGIGTGAQVGSESEETVRLCHLDNTDPTERAECAEKPKASQCDWSPIDVPAAMVPQHEAAGDRTPEALDLPQDCHRDAAAWPWFAALAPLAKVGVVVGVAGGGVVLADQIEGDDPSPATQTTP